MDTVELAKYRTRLLELRTRLTHEVRMCEESLRDDVRAPGELSNLPTHPADQAAEGVDGQIEISRNEEFLLEQVEAALERIAAGKFGLCEDCGRTIAPERLEALPYTSWCIFCARSHDQGT